MCASAADNMALAHKVDDGIVLTNICWDILATEILSFLKNVKKKTTMNLDCGAKKGI